MVKTKKGEKEQKELDAQIRETERQLQAALEGRPVSPLKKKRKVYSQKEQARRKDGEQQSQQSQQSQESQESQQPQHMSAQEFESTWARMMGRTGCKEDISEKELKELKRLMLMVFEAQLRVVKERVAAGHGAYLALEFDSTPYSSRTKSHLQAWAIDRSSSILNFELSLITTIESSSGNCEVIRCPIVSPTFLLHKKKADGMPSSEKLFHAVGKYFEEVLRSTAPTMDSGSPPLCVMIAADWASDNRLGLTYLIAHLSESLPSLNFTLGITRCVAHVLNNNCFSAATAIIGGVTDSSVKDANYSIWKRAQLISHNSVQCENHIQSMTADHVTVRQFESVGGEACRWEESRRFMALLSKGESKTTKKKLRKWDVWRLGFFEEKLVWVVGGDFPKDEDENEGDDEDEQVKAISPGGAADAHEMGDVIMGMDDDVYSSGLGLGGGVGRHALAVGDRDPTAEELESAKRALRCLSTCVKTGSSGRWTTNAAMMRSYCRAHLGWALEAFEKDSKELHIGGGLKVSLSDEWGDDEDFMATAISWSVAFVSRPADTCMLSVLKRRETTSTSMSSTLNFTKTYIREFEACMEELTDFKEGIFLLAEENGAPDPLQEADDFTTVAKCSLLAARAQLEATSGQIFLEKLEVLQRECFLTQNLEESVRRPILEECITRHFAQTKVINSHPETLCASLITPEIFQGPGNDDLTFCENVEQWCGKSATSKIDSSIVERCHAWYCRIANYLKISDWASCGARCQVQRVAASWKKCVLDMRQRQKLITRCNERRAEQPTRVWKHSLVLSGNYEFKHQYAVDKSPSWKENSQFAESQDTQDRQAEWMMKTKEEKEAFGELYRVRKRAEFEEERNADVKRMESVLKASSTHADHTIRNFWSEVKEETRSIWGGWTMGLKKARDRWREWCSFGELETDALIIDTFREQPSLMVQYVSRIAFSMSGACKKTAEALTGLNLLDRTKLPDAGGMILVGCNWDSDDEDSKPTGKERFMYLCAWSSTQPLTAGLYKLELDSTKHKVDPTKHTSYILSDLTPSIITGHSALGSRFSIYKCLAKIHEDTDTHRWFTGDELFSLTSAQANAEGKKGKHWDKEKVKIKEHKKEKTETRKKPMDIRVHMVKAADRIVFDVEVFFAGISRYKKEICTKISRYELIFKTSTMESRFDT